MPEPPQTGGRHSCFVDNSVDVEFTQTAFTPMSAVPGAGGDFVLHYVTDHTVLPPAPPAITPVIPVAGSTTDFLFRMPLDQYAGTLAARGTLVLDMTAIHPDTLWEEPEGYRAKLLSATKTPGSSGPNNTTFAIGDIRIGPGWIIQDACESAALFTYPTLPGLTASYFPCIQLSTEFNSQTSATVAGCQVPYFGLAPNVKTPNPYPGTTWAEYVSQNYPCAASEVLIEGSHIDLLLGYLDVNAANGTAVAGDFHHALAPGDVVRVALTFKDQSDWVSPPGCGTAPTGLPYPYATPEVDFVVKVYSQSWAFTCGSQPTGQDFDYVQVPKTIDPSGNEVYIIEFIGGNDFFDCLRGVRIEALEENEVQGARIAHMEVLGAEFIPSGSPGFATPVSLGWSKAFRAIILDKEVGP